MKNSHLIYVLIKLRRTCLPAHFLGHGAFTLITLVSYTATFHYMSNENEHTNLKKNQSIRGGLVTKTENQIRPLLQNFNMNSDEHEAKLEGLKNQYENRLSSVKLLDQSILNITSLDDYENELIESEEYYDTSFKLLANISQKHRE